jgi:MoaA/NifB/PqqE/SkfB family radical SAM enzyme
MIAFFAEGTPDAPGASLDHYKRTLARADGVPRWHANVGNLGLLSRAVGELAARGSAGLDVVLPAVDRADDVTELADEGVYVEAIRRIRVKAPAGFALRTVLPGGRAYVMPPPALDISTNDLCGLKCVMCGNRNVRRDPDTMSADDVDTLIRDAAAWGIRRIALTGAGEPFRDPAMLAHLELTQSLGQLATVTTNGFPITEELAERLAGMHASLSVSIHGATNATQDLLTGVRTAGDHAWRAIDRMVAAREKAGTKGRFSVNVSTVIQRGNVDEILALVQRSRDAGCDGHNLQPVNLQHGSFADAAVVRHDDDALIATLWPTAEQAPALDRLFDALVAFRRNHGHIRTSEDRLRLVRRYFADSGREALGVGCRVGESFLGIDHRGRIKPCYRLPWKLGDARLTSVRKLWNSAAYARVREVVDACPLTCMNNCFFRK